MQSYALIAGQREYLIGIVSPGASFGMKRGPEVIL